MEANTKCTLVLDVDNYTMTDPMEAPLQKVWAPREAKGGLFEIHEELLTVGGPSAYS